MKKIFLILALLYITPVIQSMGAAATKYDTSDLEALSDSGSARFLTEEEEEEEMEYVNIRAGLATPSTYALTMQFIKNNPTKSNLELLPYLERKKLIMELIEKNPTHIHIECDIIDQNTPLHESVLSFDFPYTQWLLERGAHVDYINASGETPLSALTRHIKHSYKPMITLNFAKKFIRFLIFKGADPDLHKHDRLSARQKATPETQAFIAAVEQNKLIKESLQAPDRTKIINDYFHHTQGARNCHNTGLIIASYLNKKTVKKSKHHRAASA